LSGALRQLPANRHLWTATGSSVKSSQGTNGVPNFGIDGCPGVRPPVASVGESEAPSTPTESAKSLRKRPLFHLAGRAPLPARKTPSRVIALSPIWRGGCQGVGVARHCLVGGGGRMWLRLVGRSGRPRVRDGRSCSYSGAGYPKPFVRRTSAV